MDDPLMHDHDVIIDWDAVDLEIGRQWRENSSLEKWFPFTAEQLATLTAENAALNERVEAVNREFKNFHRLICEASNYHHDETDWRRDQASCCEHVNTQLKAQLSAAVQAEREACAQEVEHWGKIQKREGGVSVWTDYVAAAIRGRANDPVKAQLSAAEPVARMQNGHLVRERLHQIAKAESRAEAQLLIDEALPCIDAMLTAPPQHAAVEEKYNELLYAVGNKYPGETRHETALRYIRGVEQPAARVPEGYMLVPVEPTDAMCVKARELIGCGSNVAHHIYLSMLTAAPTPPAQEVE